MKACNSFSLIILIIIGLFNVAQSASSTTPLDDYVWAEDDNYGWVDLGEDYRITGVGLGWTGYVLNFTSQKWLTDEDFSSNSQSGSLWWHYLVVIVPDELSSTTNATLWITGGNQGDSAPTIHSEDIALCAVLAMTTKVVTGALFQIPNEHTTFSSDPIQKSRTEDAIIAYTWDHFLNDPTQPEWLVRFPMVKASVRAMDAITEFMQTSLPERQTSLDYYSVAGASKRGWTTWLVGAVDPERVMVIVPIVLDAIHFQAVEHHQFKSYNGWSWALSDYTDMNIMERLDDPNMDLLSQYEDPYYYASRLTMPKLIVNAVLDEFQQPDDTHYWWSDMPSPKHFIMTPNAEHSEATGLLEVVPAISAWLQHQLNNEIVPTFTWEISETTGEITVTLDQHGEVYEAYVYYAHSCGTNNDDGIKRRDFRIANLDSPCGCGIFADGYCANLKSIWQKESLTSTMVKGHRTYSAHFDAPEDGRYIAYFIDITYRKGLDEPINIHNFTKNFDLFPKDLAGRLRFTSEVSIWPNTFPYEDCTGVSCGNRLL